MSFSELTDDFVRDTSALLEGLEASLLALEQAGDVEERQGHESAIRRALHTLKGNAGFLGAHHLQAHLHALEESARGMLGERGLQDRLFAAVDGLRQELRALSEGLAPESAGEALARALDGAAGEAGAEAERSLRVDARQLDTLLAASSDLVVHTLALQRLLAQTPGLGRHARAALDGLDRAGRDVHARALELRAVPIAPLLARFARLTRDEAAAQGKAARFVLEGGQARIDRALIKPLSDALVHLVKNAVAHGLEPAEHRIAAGKPAQGTISVGAAMSGATLTVWVEDDGRGLDGERIRARARALGKDDRAEVEDLVFVPGLSTAELSTSAGRGIGLDAVRAALSAFGGTVRVRSRAGAGTRFTLSLNAAVSLQRALLCQIGEETFALPTTGVAEAVRFNPSRVRWLGRGAAVEHEGRLFPLIDTRATLGVDPPTGGFAVFLEEGRRVALPVTQLLGQRDFVFHPLDAELCGRGVASGAGLLEDGRVVLRLDVSHLVSSTTREAA